MFVDPSVGFVASVQYQGVRRAYGLLPGASTVSKTSILHPKPSPIAPAAGKFGIDKQSFDRPGGYQPAGCPSLEQFEDRFLFAGPPKAS